MKKVISIVITLCLIATGIYLYTKYRVAPKIAFQTLGLVTLNGQPAQLPENKKLVVNFFATWCGPCIAEMPALIDAAEKLKSENFEVVCISDESTGKLNNFKNNSGLPLVVLKSTTPLNSLGINSIPTTYILNTKGEIVYKKTGSEKWDSPQMIEEILLKAR